MNSSILLKKISQLGIPRSETCHPTYIPPFGSLDEYIFTKSLISVLHLCPVSSSPQIHLQILNILIFVNSADVNEIFLNPLAYIRKSAD